MIVKRQNAINVEEFMQLRFYPFSYLLSQNSNSILFFDYQYKKTLPWEKWKMLRRETQQVLIRLLCYKLYSEMKKIDSYVKALFVTAAEIFPKESGGRKGERADIVN